ncbi:MAG: Matrixin [Phycisphaerales bacterium]|nr:Matrixin [Phycisphaerales bacterium]
MPLNVHVLSCKDRANVDCKLTDADIARIVGKVNGVWHKAGIHFCLDSVLHEEAENVVAFEEKRSAPDGAAMLSIYRMLAPAATRGRPGLHVYYVHELPPNGVYLGQNVCFVKETAALRKVEGGIDEPLPRVTAHELGHGLGLPHRQNTTNLMASGTTGTLLNEAEVTVARGRAAKIDGAMTVEACAGAAEAAKSKGQIEQATLLQRYLSELPK